MAAPNPESLKLVKDHSRPAITFGIARVPKSSRVFLGSSDFAVSEADLAAAKFESKDLYSHGSYVTGVTLAGKLLVSGSYDGRLIWWDIDERKQVRAHDAHAKWIRKVQSSPDGKIVASVADDMACKLWDTSNGKLIHDLRGHQPLTPTHYPSMLYAVTFSADGKLLATADKVGHIVVWDVATGKELASVEAPTMYTWDKTQRLHSIGGVRSLAFSPDGKQLAAGGTGKIGNIDHLEAKARVEVFDWQAKKPVAEFVADKSQGLVNRLAWAPDGSWLLGAGGAGEGFVIFLDVPSKKVTKQEKVSSHVHDFAMTPDARELVLVGHNKISTWTMS